MQNQSQKKEETKERKDINKGITAYICVVEYFSMDKIWIISGKRKYYIQKIINGYCYGKIDDRCHGKQNIAIHKSITMF